MKFETLPLDEKIQKGIRKAKFVTCTEVQKKALPGSLEGKDLMVQSKTGSGKTAVFILAILHRYVEATGQKPTALIIAPTRELAVQIALDAEVLASGIEGYKVGCFYGGVGYNEQEKILASKPNLIIGTPGRILDFQGSGKIDFREIDIFVIDEADRLFDMGFFPDIQKMFAFMDKKRAHQTMLFSATLTSRVRNLAWSYMNDPLIVEVEPEEITVKNITQSLYHVSKDEKFSLLLRILNKENPKNALVFSNTKAMAIELSKRLNVNGYKSQYLMGDLAQNKRLAIINRMKRGTLTFLVATDVAARGLQIDDLELVINYDIPEDYESYVHRIGRTARAGKSGKAISLACEQYVYGLEPIEKYIQMKIPVQWPDENELIKELTQTDFPDPVAPAIKRWGV
jgi:ATP-dependent RNA helicase RhlB